MPIKCILNSLLCNLISSIISSPKFISPSVNIIICLDKDIF